MNSALHWSPPSRTHKCLSVPLSTKYTLRIRNLCAQHDTIAESNKSHIVTCVCVNAICTILQPTLVTHGHLFRVRLGATKGTNIPIITHNILIIIVLLCRCSPYMRAEEGGNATSPLHSRGSPTKGTKSEAKTYARGHHDAPRNKAWIQRLTRFPQ